ncbi:aminotransferase class I/II-fold pyridoxal phosphate-dependent enzyme [Bacillus sp. FJAT-50079]|uniref:aminotransferase class I/II-fold pyridoxal phosphate-dependent enzyme n=1 Tax=Bacillus sp. FJAT-50079 TaxID=2833577 RepID=UPI0020167409|nr:aminotransferase class I/II-fold pyridoxal phosphate-dependent enzyme [Bacillus sp. FJAT-50079]
MKQESMPIFDILREHREKNSISFHVPGHKNGLLMEQTNQLFSQFLTYDLTEITGLDDLHDPQGAIAEAEQLLAQFYGTKKSYFLVNGSTVGNIAMILASCCEGEHVLVQRNCHKSILNGLMLANVRPVFISPEIDKHSGLPASMNHNRVKEAFERYSNIKVCIFTYPDYYGKTYELEQIIEIAHQHGAVVLIDEAHAPHFQLGDPFPPSSLTMNADVVVHSAHKMLPAMTMGSYLHLNSDRVSRLDIESYLSILQSSSPSYPIMASLDIARHYLASFSDEDIAYTMEKREQFSTQLSRHTDLHIHPLERGQDPLKMTIYHPYMTGFELQRELERLSIYPELADPSQVLFTLPLLKQGMIFPYDQAIEKISNIRIDGGKQNQPVMVKLGEYETEKLSKLTYSYKEMRHLSTEQVELDEAIGRIAAQMIIPYPPGIPLIMPGEEIKVEQLDQLNLLIQANARFQGGEETFLKGKIEVFSSGKPQ